MLKNWNKQNFDRLFGQKDQILATHEKNAQDLFCRAFNFRTNGMMSLSTKMSIVWPIEQK